jgi:hypothetical protein
MAEYNTNAGHYILDSDGQKTYVATGVRGAASTAPQQHAASDDTGAYLTEQEKARLGNEPQSHGNPEAAAYYERLEHYRNQYRQGQEAGLSEREVSSILNTGENRYEQYFNPTSVYQLINVAQSDPKFQEYRRNFKPENAKLELPAEVMEQILTQHGTKFENREVRPGERPPINKGDVLAALEFYNLTLPGQHIEQQQTTQPGSYEVDTKALDDAIWRMQAQWGVDSLEAHRRLDKAIELFNRLSPADQDKFNSLRGAVALWEFYEQGRIK